MQTQLTAKQVRGGPTRNSGHTAITFQNILVNLFIIVIIIILTGFSAWNSSLKPTELNKHLIYFNLHQTNVLSFSYVSLRFSDHKVLSGCGIGLSKQKSKIVIGARAPEAEVLGFIPDLATITTRFDWCEHVEFLYGVNLRKQFLVDTGTLVLVRTDNSCSRYKSSGTRRNYVRARSERGSQ